MGLYWDKGQENGNYYSKKRCVCVCVYIYMMGLYRDNAKGNRNH